MGTATSRVLPETLMVDRCGQGMRMVTWGLVGEKTLAVAGHVPLHGEVQTK